MALVESGGQDSNQHDDNTLEAPPCSVGTSASDDFPQVPADCLLDYCSEDDCDGHVPGIADDVSCGDLVSDIHEMVGSHVPFRHDSAEDDSLRVMTTNVTSLRRQYDGADSPSLARCCPSGD